MTGSTVAAARVRGKRPLDKGLSGFDGRRSRFRSGRIRVGAALGSLPAPLAAPHVLWPHMIYVRSDDARSSARSAPVNEHERGAVDSSTITPNGSLTWDSPLATQSAVVHSPYAEYVSLYHLSGRYG